MPAGTPGQLPVKLPSPATINDLSATAVSAATVTIQWTMDTVTDTSQYQAEVRSAPFLTPVYLASLEANPPLAAPGAQWNQWAAHRVYTTVSLLPENDGAPPDTAVAAYRQWGITITPRGTIPGCHPRPRSTCAWPAPPAQRRCT